MEAVNIADINSNLFYNNFDIKLLLGNIWINVLYIDYEAPRPSWHYEHHEHSSYELHVVTEGRGIVRANGREYAIVPNTLYITGPHMFHEQLADRTEPMNEYCLNFEILKPRRRWTKHNQDMAPDTELMEQVLASTTFWFGRDSQHCGELFAGLFRELSERRIGCQHNIQSLISQIIVATIRTLQDGGAANKSVMPLKLLNDTRRHLVDLYFRNWRGPLTPEELAGQIGTTVRQLQRIMQQYYGMSFKEKLISMRMEQARRLLLETGLTVGEIAEHCGYSDSHPFSSQFKKHFGLPPGAYRTKRNATAADPPI